MDPLAQAKALAQEILEMLQAQQLDWPGLHEKLKEMRDKIGELQVQYTYTQFGTISPTNPSDAAIEQMLSGEVMQFAEWVVSL